LNEKIEKKIGKLFMHTFQNIAHLLGQKKSLVTFGDILVSFWYQHIALLYQFGHF